MGRLYIYLHVYDKNQPVMYRQIYQTRPMEQIYQPWCQHAEEPRDHQDDMKHWFGDPKLNRLICLTIASWEKATPEV